MSRAAKKLINEKIIQFKRMEDLKLIPTSSKINELNNKLDEFELQKLDNLTQLKHLNYLNDLKLLEKLDNLKKLDSLIELKDLEKLEQLSKLQSLHVLSDPGVIKALEGLSRLDDVKSSWRQYLAKICLSAFLDFIKTVALVAIFAFALIKTIPSGHLQSLLPILGFGDGTRVNAGLSLLSTELSGNEFEKHFKNVVLRAEREVGLYYAVDHRLPGSFEYNLLDDLYSYDFNSSGVDLKNKIRQEMGDKLLFFKKEFQGKYDYEAEFWEKEGINFFDIEKMKAVKIFASQKRYIDALDQLKLIKEPQKIKSYIYATRWIFHEAYLESKKELSNWVGKNL